MVRFLTASCVLRKKMNTDSLRLHWLAIAFAYTILILMPSGASASPSLSVKEHDGMRTIDATFTFDATTDPSRLFERRGVCVATFIRAGSETVTLYQTTASTATGGASIATFSATTTSPRTLTIGQPNLYAVSDGATAGGSLTVHCSPLQVSSGGGGYGSQLEEVAACSANFTQPEGCPGATFTSDVATLESCLGGASDPVCVLTHSVTIQASNRDLDSAVEGIYVLKDISNTDPKLVCAPGVQIRVNWPGAVSTQLNMVEFNPGTAGGVAVADAGSYPSVHGCTVIEYVGGVPGGGAGTVEGIVYKLGSDTDKYTTQQYFAVEDSSVFIYSTGSSSVAMGVNEDGMVPGRYVRNVMYGPIGVDAKLRCEGCDTQTGLIEDNTILCNSAVSVPRGVKVDNDANVIIRDNRFHGCLFNLDSSDAAGITAGRVQFDRNLVADLNVGTAIFSVGDVQGTTVLVGSENVFTNIGLDGASSSQFILSTGGISGNLTGRFTDCPGFSTAGGEWFDIRSADGVDEFLGDLSIAIEIPIGCTLPTTAKMVPAATNTAFDTSNTRAFFKVRERTAIINGAATTPRIDQDVSASDTNDYGYPLFVQASSAADFDTGWEIAGHAGFGCLNVYVASSGALVADGDTDGETCDETISVASIVVVRD